MATSITTPDDSPPLVRVLANELRRQLRDSTPGFSGRVSLVSAADGKSVTLDIERDTIHVRPGTDKDSELTVSLDFNTRAVSKVQGFWRHPLLARKIDQLLNAPDPDWEDSAKRFWGMGTGEPGMPCSLIITCTNEHRSISFGEGRAIELVGGPAQLNSALTGSGLIAMMVATGQLRFRGTMKELAEISAIGQKIMLGELHG